MMNARRNSGFTCSGVASVAMSKSLGVDAEQQVAHGAADDERLEARLLQLARDRARAARELVAAHRMLVGRDRPRLARLGRPGIRRASRRRIIGIVERCVDDAAEGVGGRRAIIARVRADGRRQ